MVGPAAKREAVAHLRSAFEMSERRACAVIAVDRTMIRYRSVRPDDSALRDRLRGLAQERRRFGYRRLFILLRRDGEPSGVTRIYRLYREEGLMVRKRRTRRKAIGTRAPILVEAKPNARWSLDFVHDQLDNGRRFRVLNIVDDVTRECLASVPDTSISGARVVRELAALVARRGKPEMIVSDNGTELTSNAVLKWAQDHCIQWHYIAPRQTDAEWLRRELQRAHARRTAQRGGVHQHGPGPRRHRHLGGRLQHRQAALRPGIPDTGGPCRQTQSNGAGLSAPPGLRARPHCSDRATRRNFAKGSNYDRMKLPGQVSQLITEIILTPDGEGLKAEMVGSFTKELKALDQAQMLENKQPASGEAGCSSAVVAGAGFEPATFRL